VSGEWNKLVLDTSDLTRLRESSLQTLGFTLNNKIYDEIFVNVGKELLKIIEGFEAMLPKTTRVTYARGRGIGPKMAHMRDWIELNTLTK
jgi:hypothetical protein